MPSYSPDKKALSTSISSMSSSAVHAAVQNTRRNSCLAKGGAEGFLIVDAGDLAVAATNVARLELIDRLVRLELDREDPLALDGLDELPRAEVSILAGEVIEAGGAPLLAVDGVVDGLVVRVRDADVAGVRLDCV